MPKDRRQRYIDAPSASNVAPGGGADSADSPAPPALSAVEAPTNLQLSTLLSRSAATPTAIVNATWTPPDGYDIATSTNTLSYLIQWSTDSTFATNTAGNAALQPSAAIDGLTVGTVYYFRVAAVYRTVQSPYSTSASITTAVDTTPPSPPTAQAASFQGIGDLLITWTNPTSANFRDVEIKIYDGSGLSVLYATVFDATGRYIWRAADNLAATSNVGDPSLYVVLRARSWGGIFSTSVNTGTVTKSAPTAPTISVDFTGRDAVYTITPPADAAKLSFVADTAVTARTIAVAGRYAYTFDANRLDHSGTPDPSLAYSWTALDGLNQASSATTGTATNAAPSAPTVTLIGGFAQLVASVTSAPAADFAAYEYVWKRDGSTVLTLESASSEQQYATGASGDEGSHSWTVVVRQKDVFGQYSSTTTSSAVVLDTLTISYLRAGLIFTDSVGNSVSSLNVLKDGVTASGGQSYAA
jgi:Fibronectin type III domain